MTTRTRHIALSLIAALFVVVGIAAVVRSTQPESCGGVDRSLGGCDDGYAFVATDCISVGREFGEQLDSRIAMILAGPDAVAEESRGVRMNHQLTVGITRARRHLTAAAMRCDGSQFADAVLAQVSPAVRDGAGPAMYIDRHGTYDEWATEVRSVVTGIIDGMETPVPT